MQFFIKGLNHYNDTFKYNTKFFCIMTFFDILRAIILPPILYIVYSMLIMCYMYWYMLWQYVDSPQEENLCNLQYGNDVGA